MYYEETLHQMESNDLGVGPSVGACSNPALPPASEGRWVDLRLLYEDRKRRQRRLRLAIHLVGAGFSLPTILHLSEEELELMSWNPSLVERALRLGMQLGAILAIRRLALLHASAR